MSIVFILLKIFFTLVIVVFTLMSVEITLKVWFCHSRVSFPHLWVWIFSSHSWVSIFKCKNHTRFFAVWTYWTVSFFCVLRSIWVNSWQFQSVYKRSKISYWDVLQTIPIWWWSPGMTHHKSNKHAIHRFSEFI
jgi:hypothetical protein